MTEIIRCDCQHAALADHVARLERHNALLRAVAEVAAQLEPDLARLFAGPLSRALDAARKGGALERDDRLPLSVRLQFWFYVMDFTFYFTGWSRLYYWCLRKASDATDWGKDR